MIANDSQNNIHDHWEVPVTGAHTNGHSFKHMARVLKWSQLGTKTTVLVWVQKKVMVWVKMNKYLTQVRYASYLILSM